MRRLIPTLVFAFLLSSFLPSVSDAGCDILFYNLWTHPMECCGYDNSYYDDDLPAVLSAEGHNLTLSNRGEIPILTDAILSEYQEVWIIGANNLQTPFVLDSEVEALANYMYTGGGVAFFGDHDDFFEDINEFTAAFGAVYTGSVWQDEPISTDGFEPSPLWEGVETIGGAMSEGDIMVFLQDLRLRLKVIATNNGANMVATGSIGDGRVVLDATFGRLMDDEFVEHHHVSILEYDNEVYVANIANWLCNGRSVSEQESPGLAELVHKAQPNPFRSSARITYGLEESGWVRVSVYDAGGRLLSTLGSGWKEAGSHSELWDGRGQDGRRLPSGVFFYTIDTAEGRSVGRILLMK